MVPRGERDRAHGSASPCSHAGRAGNGGCARSRLLAVAPARPATAAAMAAIFSPGSSSHRASNPVKEHNRGTVVKCSRDGRTALHIASENGRLKVVKELIAAGAKVDVQENDGCTALSAASRWGYSKVVKELIAAGAKVDVQNYDGRTALYIASENGHSEVVTQLIAAGANVAPPSRA
ncbi:hypothetical protein DIPPA_08168 [Diplonema papillatum]|nr:hypothetical protein DIPPA_08168 [Diplonema papillatum]